MTNNHVIEGATEVKIALADKREFEAEILLKDARTDLAVLRVKDGREKFTAIDLGNSDELQVGDVVLALGNPFGVGQTVTHGIISALARTQVGITDYQFFIQTDAAINPGNSGGALVDLAGRLVGLNTAIFSRSGGSQGIGFAIPVNMVKVVIASAKTGGTTVRRPWLGAKLQTVTPDIAESLGLKRPTGALVATVTEKSPAARAGLKTGDLIVAVDGQLVDDSNAFDYRFATKPLGGSAQLGLLRGGKEVKVAVALETAPETPRDEILIRTRSPFMGVKVANISPALADELRLDPSAEGRRRCWTWRPARWRRASASSAATSSRRSTTRRSRARAISTGSPRRRRGAGRSPSCAAGRRFRCSWADEHAAETRPEPVRSRRPRSRRAASARRPAAADETRPRWSGRTICSGRTARSPACWRRARSAR